MDERVREWLQKQRDDLINMTRSNRLLYFKHLKVASLEISEPTPTEVLERLNRSGASNDWKFYLPPGDDVESARQRAPKPTELVIADKEKTQIERALHELERKTTQQFVDKGLWVLYLGLGMLHWVESAADDKPAAGPILLVPVTVARDSFREPFRLRRTEDDPVINPALAVKLDSDFDLALPTVDDFEDIGLEGVIRKVEDLVRDRDGWSVERRAVLCTFTFQKEAMYRDLLDHEDELVADPTIQVLALGPDTPSAGTFDFEPIGEDQLDRKVAPEDLVSVKDADATQRICILAARDGHSFVMDGPPGSGKSQTITNIIAELLHAGKTVLFVSEKAAALEVVHNRLKEASLDEFALQLHSHNATRKAVAAELGRALSRRPTANDSFTQSTRADLVSRREALTAYAQALNEARRPLGRSLHQALGRIAQLQAVPQAPVPSGFGRSLTQEQLSSLRDTAATLGRNWGPVERGGAFLWRDLKNAKQSASRQGDLERDLGSALNSLEELRERVEAIDGDLGLGWYDSPREGRRLLTLLQSVDERRDIPTFWLTVDALDAVNERCAELSTSARQYHATLGGLRELVGDGASEVQANYLIDIDGAMSRLAERQPSWQPDAELGNDALTERSSFLDAASGTLAEILADSRRLASAFGLPAEGISLNRAAELAELGSMVDSATRPEPQWLNPAVQAALDEAVRVLDELLQDFRLRQEDLRGVFTDDVLGLDLSALNVRFNDVHRGVRKLRRAYRDDKRALAACSVTGKVDRRVRERLADAAAWKDLADRLTAAESRHAGLLGEHYYQRADADFSRITSAIETARRALSLAGEGAVAEEFTRQLALGESPDPALPQVAQRLQSAVASWLDDARRRIGPTTKRLQAMPVDTLSAWCQDVASELRVLMGAVKHVSDVANRPVSLAFASKVIARASEAQQLRESVVGRHAEDAELLGDRFRGVDTDWESLTDALSWTADVRAVLEQPVRRQVAEAILDCGYTSAELSECLTQWRKARDLIINQFVGGYADTIAEAVDESFADADELLHRLNDTVGDIGEWATHANAKARLEQHGLEPVVAFCLAQRVAGDQVHLIVERALLEAWADDVMDSDSSRLGSDRAPDRDALVREFQELDSRQVAHAAARVINRCAQRRPNSTAGEAGIVQREGEKQRKHMPIRTLLDKAGTAAQRLKPCFMMSPLSVSQYLPASLRFDVVIFDEASQVRPCDVVNCVYRAGQLIVAGDQKQLPPTSFFATIGAADDDSYDEEQIDDFESVLDLCKAGGLRSLPLRWHYRSQHESLITYSNYGFYGGRLLTYPGATDTAPDVGVELFKVDGIYRRGGARDNPVEAAKVIERVLYHRRQHPGLTLGVVTFSGAQEDAIENELERQAQNHPELAGLTGDDRLHGFFVKNLENVQGDERDVIIFSVGYGPDENDDFKLNMGPLNKKGGERRLNVAITRAKQRVEIVTSVLAERFPNKVMSDGVRHLRGYLDFAVRGQPALALDPEVSKGDVESPFEEEVLRAIQSWGYKATPQVGVAGYRIDIGVRDADRPGRFVLGVECDGAMYHSSKVARDRDRLRQQVLEGLDWRIHRIWGTSWYRDRAGQEQRLRDAIESTLRGEQEASIAARTPVEAVEVKHEEIDLDAVPPWTVPYRLADIGWVSTPWDMHQPEGQGRLRTLIKEVVRQETPVHEERVLTAARKAWGVGRAGSRIKDAFDRAVRYLSRSELERDDAGFLSTEFATLEYVRVPSDDPDTQREVKHIPQQELQLAIAHVVRDAHSIRAAEVSVRVARLFGWKRRGPDVSAALEEAVEELVRSGELRSVNDRLVHASTESAG